MDLYTADGDRWNPYYEDTRVLDEILRRIVDALRYRRPRLDDADAYGQALTLLSVAATEYTSVLRRAPEAAGDVPPLRRRAS